jgi:hypothetical protein
MSALNSGDQLRMLAPKPDGRTGGSSAGFNSHYCVRRDPSSRDRLDYDVALINVAQINDAQINTFDP